MTRAGPVIAALALASLADFARAVPPDPTAPAAPPAPAAPAGGCWRFLPGPTRGVSLGDTASRDAPVLEYAFGPRAQLSLGHALTLASDGDTHFVVSGLAAIEDATGGAPFPDQALRILGTAQIAWDLGRRVELGLELGVERARELVAAPSNRLDLPIGPRDIPFGGGGAWVGLDLSLRAPLAPGWTLDLRLAERMYINAFPQLVGARAEADTVASFFGEGLMHAPSLAVGLRWSATDVVQPFARLFAELLVPHDDNADLGGFVRLVTGAAIVGASGELEPFVSVDVGNGKGLLVNRHELRLSFGARHVFR